MRVEGGARRRGLWPKRLLFALSCVIATATAAAQSPAGNLDTSSWFDGTVTGEGYGVVSQGFAPLAPDGWSWGSTTTLSAGLGVKGQRTSAEASFDGAALTGSQAAAAFVTAAQAGSGLIVEGTSEDAISFRLRTLWAKIDYDWASLEFGRQVVNYGRGALWSPADIFAFLDLSGATPDRLGTDAIRLKVPLGAVSGLDIVAEPTTDPVDGRYSARVFDEVLGVDSGLLGAWDGGAKRILAAGDCKFDFGPSYYLEALWSVDPSAPDPLGSSWTRAVAGLDWSTGDFLFAGEYYWNGAGAAAVTDIDYSFPSRQYIFATVVWDYSDFGFLSLAETLDAEGLLPRGAPWRTTAIFSLDASQNATIEASLDAIRGDFVTMSGDGWTATLGASLVVKF